MTYDKIRVDVSDTCRCEICGVEQGILTAHIRQVHKISGLEYRSRFPGAELTSERVRADKMAKAQLFPHWEPVWSVEYALDRIKEYEIRGHPISYTWIAKNDRGLAAACLSLLGSWDGALQRLGLEPSNIRLNARSVRLSRWDVVEELRKRMKQKLPMNYSAIENTDLRLANAARRKFGSFRKALEAAGIKPEAVALRPAFYTRSDLKLLISEAKRVALLKGSARWNAAKILHREFELMVQSYFGNWCRVAEVAQVESHRLLELRLCHKEFVIEWLAERAESGKRMTPSEIFREDRGLYSAIRRHYGSVSEMLRQLEAKHFLINPARTASGNRCYASSSRVTGKKD